MDPKNINQLDPKLKEAYDRVMGMDLSSSVPPPNQSPAPLNPANSLPQTPPLDIAGTHPEPAIPSNPNIPPPPPPLNPAPEEASSTVSINTPEAPLPPLPTSTEPVLQSFNASTTPLPEAPNVASPSTEVAKSKSKVSPAIFIIVAFVFFVIYGVLWGKIFGIF